VIVYFHYFAALDTNVSGEEEEEEEFEEFEEQDQGQAEQGKPSNLVAYLILILLIACFINVYENACFYVAITSR
jgi:hypothetical protein